jgi:hypothetical protein
MRKELNWSALLDDKLTEEEMFHIRGGDGDEDPNGPIIK